MVETLVAIGILAVVVAALFVFVWMADAKRSKQVENDEERQTTDEHLPNGPERPS